ncbi:MAG TPA: TIGR00730 family Rossman fold protein [Candidatus Sulfotelmatobacter sp.]|nr:TIGR00730 family Rossman fold protein [Candidatus Sulfotelmatobacter sp.]
MSKPGVCFFGSASDAAPAWARTAAAEFGAACARNAWRLVYGGSRKGLMAAAAQAALAGGGEVIGVMPERLVARELADPTITRLHVVASLAERKQMMADLSDLFVALPGGVGTLDELTEMVTWHDLGVHEKPTVLANLDGFWDPLLDLLARFRDARMLRPTVGGSLVVVDGVPALVAAVAGLLDRRPTLELGRDPLA